MTDDEQAQAVLEVLTGATLCPECGRPMRTRISFYDARGWPAIALHCNGQWGLWRDGEWKPHEDVYMLLDGTRIVPSKPL